MTLRNKDERKLNLLNKNAINSYVDLNSDENAQRQICKILDKKRINSVEASIDLGDLAERLRQDKPNLSMRSIDDVWKTKV